MNDRLGSVPALLVSAGLVLGGWLAGQGFVQARRVDRFVTVKGVAERTVSADLGLWPLRFVASDDVLANARDRIGSQERAVMAFLARHGLDSTTVDVLGLEVTDMRANPYSGGPTSNRYIITMSMMVRSEDAAKLQAASQRTGELVEAGVLLGGGFGGGPAGGPTYLFTRLNELKPAMIAEATASARQSAEQFARDAGSGLGRIRRANQGVFEILPRDQAPGIAQESQVQKTLRVVTTIEYEL